MRGKMTDVIFGFFSLCNIGYSGIDDQLSIVFPGDLRIIIYPDGFAIFVIDAEFMFVTDPFR